MKLHYFFQASADPDDGLHAQAVEYGHVPSTCLLGGVVLEANLNTSADPCAECFGPRARCGGAPRAEENDAHAGDRAYVRALLTGEGLGAAESTLERLLRLR